MVAIHLPLDSHSGRGSYGIKGEIPLIKRDDVFLNSQGFLLSFFDEITNFFVPS
jgi:hypothetical protein